MCVGCDYSIPVADLLNFFPRFPPSLILYLLHYLIIAILIFVALFTILLIFFSVISLPESGRVYCADSATLSEDRLRRNSQKL